MLTNNGKLHIKRCLANATAIGRSISLGIGQSAESVASQNLDFEFVRADVELVSYDFTNNRLVFKAKFPEWVSGTIYEVGLWSESTNQLSGAYASRTLTEFDSSRENWAGTYSTANSRIGADSLVQAPGASATVSNSLTSLGIDLSGNSDADLFIFAFHVVTAPATVQFDFITDASNYYRFTVSGPTAGYKVVSANKASATVTGAPSWANITEIRVRTTAGAGAAEVHFDGVRLEDVDTINPEYTLVSREVLTTPVVKEYGKALDVEHSLVINIP